MVESSDGSGAGLAVPVLLWRPKGGKKHDIFSSVPDPDPNPDPHVFGPPGSGSTSLRYESGSFYQQAKIVRKTLIPTVL